MRGFIHEGIRKVRCQDGARDTMHDVLLRAVGIDRADDLATRVVVHRGPLGTYKISFTRYNIIPADREERLVLLNYPALVVIDLPATDDNIWFCYI